ncbi:MAG: thiol-disulfide oxidoreductase DCC family protein [Acidimicrobiia bacterium]
MTDQQHTAPTRSKPSAIVFYDGFCAVCSSAVGWIIDHDPDALIKFAPLQGSTASQAKLDPGSFSIDSLVYVSNLGIATESTAVRMILGSLGTPAPHLAGVMSLIPTTVADSIYRLVAKRRHMISKRLDRSCRIPADEDRSRFLA